MYATPVSQQRHRSPSPVPSGQLMPTLLQANQMQFGASLGEALAQGGHAPTFSDPNSEGMLSHSFCFVLLGIVALNKKSSNASQLGTVL